MKSPTAVVVGLMLLFLGAFGMVVPQSSITAGVGQASHQPSLISNTAPRFAGLHDAGDLFLPVFGSSFSYGSSWGYSSQDPETGKTMQGLEFPKESNKRYMLVGAIWIGGIIDGDTIVSQAFDPYNTYNIREFAPEDTIRGSTWRTGNFADDEFVITTVDTVSPTTYRTLGLKVTTVSYSWADTLYDNFAILTYTVHNIGNRPITDSWAGVYVYNDVRHDSTELTSYSDDCSGVLDTILYDDDPGSRVLVPYCFDNDGDPLGNTAWGPYSVRGAVSIRLLDAAFPVEHQNFNWWSRAYYEATDFGPRRLGTPDDPLRLFGNGRWLGSPITDEERYYLMAHPEVDYDQMDILIHDSADGWVPSSLSSGYEYANGFEATYLLSFGPFNLEPGDSTSFTLAVAVADDFHREPSDFRDTFDALNPSAFRSRLDFGPLLREHRRIDSVYASGLLLPQPGPPQGLHIIDYDDGFVRVGWWPCRRPDLAGYYLNVEGYSGQWGHASPYLITDTTAVFSVPDPSRNYLLAVSLVDSKGRESKVSLPVAIIPDAPHSVQNLSVRPDGIVPELAWRPYPDVSVQAFLIYRAVWEGPFALYDSTAARTYRDINTQSGVQYHYQVTAKNIRGLESVPTAPVTIIPMAKDKGVLFYSLNRPRNPNGGPYQDSYLERLYRSATGVAPIAWYNYAQGALGLKQMADYAEIVVDWEKREDGLPPETQDSLRWYLLSGGRALFIVLGTENIGATSKTYRYADGSLFHDALKLDSAVTGGFVLQHGSFHGDLVGCQSLLSSYPSLAADTEKLAASPLIPVEGYIPMAGYFFPTAEAEPIYSYMSSNPDTVSEGQINGIRYLGDDYQFVLLGFPLSLMREPASFWALQQALVDLGVDMECGDVWGDGRLNLSDLVYLINYLYRDGTAPENMAHADVDHSGSVDVADAVTLINYMYRGGAWLRCPQ